MLPAAQHLAEKLHVYTRRHRDEQTSSRSGRSSLRICGEVDLSYRGVLDVKDQAKGLHRLLNGRQTSPER